MKIDDWYIIGNRKLNIIQKGLNGTHLSNPFPHILFIIISNFVTRTTKAKKDAILKSSMAATTTNFLLPKNQKPFSHFLTNPPSTYPIHVSILTSLDYPSHSSNSTRTPNVRVNAKKKNPWLDPFDDGEDPNIEYGSLFADGKQDEDPRPPDNLNSPYGYLKFPAGYAVEIASLGSKVRGDVRRCCCVVAGGVYENLLFFPTIQLIKDRYPGVQIDVVGTDRGKQCYELNKNVRWANVFDPEDEFPEPAEYTDSLGVLRVGVQAYLLNTLNKVNLDILT